MTAFHWECLRCRWRRGPAPARSGAAVRRSRPLHQGLRARRPQHQADHCLPFVVKTAHGGLRPDRADSIRPPLHARRAPTARAPSPIVLALATAAAGAGRLADGGGVAEWFRQGPAKPCTGVRFSSPPQCKRPGQGHSQVPLTRPPANAPWPTSTPSPPSGRPRSTGDHRWMPVQGCQGIGCHAGSRSHVRLSVNGV